MKIKNILIILLFAISFVACDKGFLELAPPSEVNALSFYKTSDDVKNGVSAAYASMKSGDQYFGDFITLMENRSDNVEDDNPGGNAGREYNIDFFMESPDNTILLDVWSSLYDGIYRCNTVLTKMQEVSMDESLKAQYQGELLFLRALNHFHLVRLWGKVPVVQTAISTQDAHQLIRNEVVDVYKAIEEDLTKSITLLPSSYSNNSLGRATSGAARALLGKVYLTQKKYNEAKTALEATMNGTFGLLNNVADVFDTSNEMNKEIIFAVRFSKTIEGEGHGLHWVHNSPLLDPNLLNAYEATDERRDLLNTIHVDVDRDPVKKFYDEEFNKRMGNDFPVLRYADVLLMYAEVLNELGMENNAITELNKVRVRAKASEYTNLTGQQAVRDAILLERRLELPLENHRWFDLIRTGKAIDAIKALGGEYAINIKDYHVLYAVPKSEIDIVGNPEEFGQNPGY